MEMQDKMILVSAPTQAGEAFLHALKMKGLPFAALVNNKAESDRLRQLGVNRIVEVDTKNTKNSEIPEFPISKVFLFERSLTLCCRYIQICRLWTGNNIYVITQGHHARLIYKGIGANEVIHSQSKDLTYLLE